MQWVVFLNFLLVVTFILEFKPISLSFWRKVCVCFSPRPGTIASPSLHPRGSCAQQDLTPLTFLPLPPCSPGTTYGSFDFRPWGFPSAGPTADFKQLPTRCGVPTARLPWHPFRHKWENPLLGPKHKLSLGG